MFPSRALLPGILVVMLALALLVFALPAAAAQPATLPLPGDDAVVSDNILRSSTELTYTVRLPFVTRQLPAPIMNPINNPASLGSYEVTWSPVAGALRYDVQEDDNPGFLNPDASTGGPGVTSWRFGSHKTGTWYYRVKATYASGDSVWSLPVSTTVLPGIAGFVTYQGAPIGGIHLHLRFFNGSSYSTILQTDTAANGLYRFTGAPALTAGQSYYVLYDNDPVGGNVSDPRFLTSWGAADITSYGTGWAVAGSDFDLADVVLAGPAPGATVGLPATFQWVMRMPRAGEGYQLALFKLDGSGQAAATDPLGYVSSVTVTGLPSSFGAGIQYGWSAMVYDALGGQGLAYYYRRVTFGSAAAGQPGLESEVRNEFRDRIEVMRTGATPVRIEER